MWVVLDSFRVVVSASLPLTAVHSVPSMRGKSVFVDMANIIEKFIVRLNQATCKHLHEYPVDEGEGVSFRSNMIEQSSPLVVGDWSEPMLHPHPYFGKKGHKCQRQPIAVLMYCKTCAKTWIAPGFNYRGVEDQLPGITADA